MNDRSQNLLQKRKCFISKNKTSQGRNTDERQSWGGNKLRRSGMSTGSSLLTVTHPQQTSRHDRLAAPCDVPIPPELIFRNAQRPSMTINPRARPPVQHRLRLVRGPLDRSPRLPNVDPGEPSSTSLLQGEVKAEDERSRCGHPPASLRRSIHDRDDQLPAFSIRNVDAGGEHLSRPRYYSVMATNGGEAEKQNEILDHMCGQRQYG